MVGKFSWSLKRKVEEKVPVVEDKVDDVVSVDAPLDSVVDVAPLPVVSEKVLLVQKSGDVTPLNVVSEYKDASSASQVSAKDDAVGKELLVEKRDPMAVFGAAFGGSKATLDGNIADLSDGSKNISMKTKIRDVQALSVWEFVGKSAEREVLSDGSTLKVIGDMYAELANLIKSNSCSEDGWRSEQLERIYTARREAEDMFPPINKMDGLLVRNKR